MPVNFVVNNTSDSGLGSLRQAVLDANASASGGTISFAIPGAGPHKITLLSDMPSIVRPVTIDGYSQTGAVANTLTTGSNASLMIEIDGASYGITLTAGATGSTVRGLVMSGFAGSAIRVEGGSHRIQGNFFGTDTAGSSLATQTNFVGIWLLGGSNHLIGGSNPAERNVIAGSSSRGIFVSNSTGNTIANNYIGTNAAGTVALGNSRGVEINGDASSNQIRNNLISGNAHGILLAGNSNIVQGNWLGTDAAGTDAIANGDGIWIAAGSNNTIGGTGAGESNQIANSNSIAIRIDESPTAGTGNRILGNSIRNNGALGIDLGSNGITVNDDGDGDSGANARQNTPILAASTFRAGSTAILGALNSTASTSFIVELFASDTNDGEGAVFLGRTNVTTNASGNTVFSFSQATDLTGKWITATATNSTAGNTSEFSRPIVTAINSAPVLSTSGNPALTTINEDISSSLNTGTRIRDLISGLITDANGDPTAIAITGIDSSNGTWQYSLDGGTTWTNIAPTTSDSTALLLGATSFYSANLATTPATQGWLSYTSVNIPVSGMPTPALGTEISGANGASVNTTGNQRIYAGYSNYSTSGTLVNPGSPVLNATAGYSVSFDLQVFADSNTNPNRAGFSLLLVSQDPTKAIELAFQRTSATAGRIFAQQDATFVAGENIAFDVNQKTDYRVEVQGTTYKLFANNTQILTGNLRDYRGWTPPANFPFDPYERPNLIFLGDNTTSAQGSFNLSQVVVQTDNRIRFLPNANYSGSANINFRAWDTTDGGTAGATVNAAVNGDTTAYSSDTETATITVNSVNDDPTAIADTATVAEDSGATLINVLVNDSFAPDAGETLSITAVGATSSGGTATISGNTISYTPAANFNGTETFTYTISDGNGGTSTSSVTVTVTAANDAPTLIATAANPSFTEATGLGTQAVAVTLFSDASASPFESGQTLTSLSFIVSGLADGVSEQLGVDGTTITLGANSSGTTTTNSLDYTVSISGSTATITLTKATGLSAANFNSLINSITYQNTNTDNPTAGSRSFTFTEIKDSGGTANGGLDTTALTLTSTVTVAGVNDPATIGDPSAATVTEDADPTTLTATGTLSINDADQNQNSFNTSVVSASGNLGSLALASDGTYTYSVANSAVQSLGEGQTKTETFTVEATDGSTKTISFIINGVNDAPTISTNTLSITEGSMLALSSSNISATDSDNTPDQLSYTASNISGGRFELVVNPGVAITSFTQAQINAGAVQFVHDGGEASPSYNLTVSDGLTTSAASPVTIGSFTNTNDAPTIIGKPETTVSEDSSYSFTPTANDVDTNTTLTFSITNKPSWAMFDSATGTLSGTPTNDDLGTTAGIIISVSDGSETVALPEFDLTVNNTNDLPTLSGQPDTLVAEDSVYSFTPIADDVDANTTLTFSIANKPAWATFDEATGTLSGTPTNEDVGTTSGILISVSDGIATVELPAFDLTVENTNDDPSSNGFLPDQTATEGAVFSFTVPADSFQDIDLSDSLSYSVKLLDGSDLPTWLSFDPVTCSFSGTPLNANVGQITISLSATDQAGEVAESSFSLTVINVNQPAEVGSRLPTRLSATATQPFSLAVPSDAFTDPDLGDSLTLSAALSNGASLPSWLTFDPATGTLSGTPNLGAVGNFALQIIATDRSGVKTAQTLNLTIDNPTGLTAAATPDITLAGGQKGLNRRAEPGTVLRGSFRSDLLKGTSGNDTIISGIRSDSFGRDRLYGFDGDDRLFAGGGNDYVDGGKGNDQLRGGRGRDLLLGGEGNDQLAGGQGDDILVSGRGSDQISGGQGRDMFGLNDLSEAGDTITDFNPAEDLIDLRAIFAQPQYAGATPYVRHLQYVQFVQTGSNTELRVDADGSGAGQQFTTLVTLQNVSAAALSSQQFVIA